MRLPRAYMTSRQVGLVMGIHRERVRQIEDAAIAIMASRLGCSDREVIAHLYAIQEEVHGDRYCRPDWDPPRDDEWISVHARIHYRDERTEVGRRYASRERG